MAQVRDISRHFLDLKVFPGLLNKVPHVVSIRRVWSSLGHCSIIQCPRIDERYSDDIQFRPLVY